MTNTKRKYKHKNLKNMYVSKDLYFRVKEERQRLETKLQRNLPLAEALDSIVKKLEKYQKMFDKKGKKSNGIAQ